jgi:hypothetical protein
MQYSQLLPSHFLLPSRNLNLNFATSSNICQSQQSFISGCLITSVQQPAALSAKVGGDCGVNTGFVGVLKWKSAASRCSQHYALCSAVCYRARGLRDRNPEPRVEAGGAGRTVAERKILTFLIRKGFTEVWTSGKVWTVTSSRQILRGPR